MSITTKEELLEALKVKGIKEEKVKAIWKEKEAQVKASGIKEEEVQKWTMKKVGLYFRKMLSGTDQSNVKIVPIGASNATDYGAKKNYDQAVKLFNTDKEQAIRDGFTDEKGRPLWKNSIASRNGKPIIPERELRRTIYCFAKREDQDTVWKIGLLTIQGESLRKSLPDFGKVYAIEATIGKATKERFHDEQIMMYGDVDFGTPKGTESVKELIREHLSKRIIKFADLKMRARMDNANSDFFFVKANIVKTNETMPGMSNLVIISDPDELSFDEDDGVTGWMAEDIALNVVDEAMDAIVFMNARAYMKKDENGVEAEALQANIFSIFPRKEDQKTLVNTPEVGNDGQEVVVEEELVEDSPKKEEAPKEEAPKGEEKKDNLSDW